MDNLNYQFYEEFLRLDRLIIMVYQVQDGVSDYIKQMASVSSTYAMGITGWISDMEQLYRFRSVRNALAQSTDAFKEPLCDQGDIDWMKKFYQRIIDRKDPLALLKFHGYRADDDSQQRRLDEQAPAAEAEFRNSHDRYVNGPLVVGLIIAAVVVTCLFCLFVLTKLS